MNLTKGGFDWWLAGLCLSRTGGTLVFLSYAAAIPVLQKEWSMSAAAAGSISSGFHLCYGLSLVVLSSLADRTGPKRVYLGSLGMGAALSLAFAFWAGDYLSGLILYSLVGLALGGTYTTGLMLLADHYPAHRRGRAIGFFIASSSLGYALSLIISGLALPRGGYGLAFLLTGLGPLVATLLAGLTLARTKVVPRARSGAQRFTKEVLRNKPAVTLIAGYTCHAFELLGMWAWTPAFLTLCLVGSGLDGSEAIGWGPYLTAFFHLTGLLASFTMGMLSDRAGRARVMFHLSLISTTASFVFGWTIGWPLVLIVALGAVYAFSGIGDSPVLSTALTETVDPAFLGSAFGIRSILGFGAGALAPLAFGAVLDRTNPGAASGAHQTWGWAYGVLGLAGLGAVIMAHRFGRLEKDRLEKDRLEKNRLGKARAAGRERSSP